MQRNFKIGKTMTFSFFVANKILFSSCIWISQKLFLSELVTAWYNISEKCVTLYKRKSNPHNFIRKKYTLFRSTLALDFRATSILWLSLLYLITSRGLKEH